MTEAEAVRYISRWGRYCEHVDPPYLIEYNGKCYYRQDTRELVEVLLKGERMEKNLHDF